MPQDLIDNLRHEAAAWDAGSGDVAAVLRRAADTIESQAAEIARLTAERDALREDAKAEARNLAAHLARELFALGEACGGYPVSRIAFKLGTYGNEREGGGLAEEPLARFLEEALLAKRAPNTDHK